MESWYLLYCKRGQLLRAKEHLERQAVHCLSPMIAMEKIVRGKRTTVEEPLFPNYLFIEFDPEDIHTTTISATRGVSHFVRFGAQPAIVPPVPAAQVKPSIRPSICAQISSAVPTIWALRLAVLSNWLAQIALGVSSAIRRDVWTKWPGFE